MKRYFRHIAAAAAAVMIAAAACGCGNSQNTAAEGTTEVVAKQTEPEISSENKYFVDSLRIFTNFEDVIAEEKKEKSQKKDTEKKKETESVEGSTEGGEETGTTVQSSQAPSGQEGETTEASAESTTQEPIDESKLTEGFALGTVDEDGFYRNTYFNLQYPLDSTWQVDTREQLLLSNNITFSYADDTELAKRIQFEKEFKDLSVTINQGKANLIICTMNDSAFTKYFYGHKTAKKYYYTKLYSYYEGLGYKDILVTKGTKKLAGIEFESLNLQMSDGKTDYFIKVLFTKKDNFIDMIVITSKGENLNDILIQPLTAIPEESESTAEESSEAAAEGSEESTGEASSGDGEDTGSPEEEQ